MTKKRNIRELILETNLNPQHLDGIISNFVKTAIAVHEKKLMDTDSIMQDVKKKVLSDEFIEQFVPSFDAVFTDEEIKTLLTFYKSDVLKKFSDAANELTTPIYMALNKLILSKL